MQLALRRFLLPGFLFGIIFTLTGQSGIQFTEGTWDEVRSKALEENKMIFMDVYTTWCGPCKRMSQNVFTDPQVGVFFNQHFINYQIDAERGEGIGLSNQYQIGAYPTMLFVDYNGQLIHKMTGYRPSEPFLDEAMSVADPQHVPEIAQKYKEDLSYQRMLLQQEKEKQNFMATLQKNPTFAITYQKYALGERNPELLSSYILQREELKLRDTNVWKEIAPYLDTVQHPDLAVFASRSLWRKEVKDGPLEQELTYLSQMSSPEKFSFAGRTWYDAVRDDLLEQVQLAANSKDSALAVATWDHLQAWSEGFEKSQQEIHQLIRDSKINYAKETGNLKTLQSLVRMEIPDLHIRYDSAADVTRKREILREAVDLLLTYQGFETDKTIFADGLALAEQVLSWEQHPDSYAAVAFFQFRLGASNEANLTVRDGMILGKRNGLDTSLLFKIFAKEKP